MKAIEALKALTEGKKVQRAAMDPKWYFVIEDDGLLYLVNSETGEKKQRGFAFPSIIWGNDDWSEYKELYTFQEMFEMMLSNFNRVFRFSYDDGSYTLFRFENCSSHYRIMASHSVDSKEWYELHTVHAIQMTLKNEKGFELVSE